MSENDNDKDLGWYPKYIVLHADGSPLSEGADPLVLRLDKDPGARTAALVYARECKRDYPRLSADLHYKVATEYSHPVPPPVVCLCGSTRFSEAYQQANLQETLAGKIVLTIGCDMKTDAALFEHLSASERNNLKWQLDLLHFQKIRMADEVLILNVGGYVGESTQREIWVAQKAGKTIRYWEPDAPGFKIGQRIRLIRDEEVHGESQDDDDSFYEWVEMFPAGSEGVIEHIYFDADRRIYGYNVILDKPEWGSDGVEWEASGDEIEAVPTDAPAPPPVQA